MSKKTKRALTSLVIILLTLTALFLRINRLGYLSFVADEGFTYLCVKGILNHGKPLLPSGFVYYKSILYSYLASLPVALLGFSEFSLRLTSVIFGTLMVPLAYRTGKELFNRPIGLVSAVVLTFSTWEISLSRGARYYTPFQFLYLLSIYFFYRGFFREQKKYKIAAVISFILTSLTHKLGITLILAFLTFLILRGIRRFAKRDVIISLAIILIFFAGWELQELLFWQVGGITSSVKSGGGLDDIFTNYRFDFFHQFQWLYPRMYIFVWLGVGLLPLYILQEKILRRLTGKSTSKGMVAGKDGIILTYTMLILPLLTMGLMEAHMQPRYVFYLHPLFLLLFCFTLYVIAHISLTIFTFFLLDSPRHGFLSARYDTLKILVFLVLTFFLVENAHPLEAYQISQAEHGESQDSRFAPSTTRRFHYDHKGPGEFVRHRLAKDDLVISMHMVFQHIYAGRSDYWLWTGGRGAWPAWHEKDGLCYDNYLGTEMIRDLVTLQNTLAENKDRRIWIITSPSINDHGHINRDVADFLRNQRDKLVYTGRDNVSQVFLWSPNPGESERLRREEHPEQVIYEAERLYHQTGKIKSDRQASGKKAVLADRKTGPGFLVYGPYQEFEKGKYLATFRLKAGKGKSKDTWCSIDIATEKGQKVLAKRSLTIEDFPRRKSYCDFPLPFDLTGNTELEFRVSFNSNGEIWVDKITVSLLDSEIYQRSEVEQTLLSQLKGEIVFQSNRDGDWEIYVMNADGSNIRKLTDNDWDDEYPVWSPDGKQIAFKSKKQGNWDIYLMDEDSSNQQQLTTHQEDNQDPCWSPDGKQIAFSSNRDGGSEIYIMDKNGNNTRRITDSIGESGLAAWSPDGQQIAHTSNRFFGWEVCIMDSDGSNIARLTSKGGNCRPDWSPDGRKIAFVSDRFEGQSDIWIMNPDGSDQKRLTMDSDKFEYYPAWSPDGKFIAYAQSPEHYEGNWEIHIIKVEDGTDVQLTFNPSADKFPDWRMNSR